MTAGDRRNRIVNVVLEEPYPVRRRPEVEHERAVAIYDLIEENMFEPLDCLDDGPFNLHLSVEDYRLIFDVRSQDGVALTRVPLSLKPFRTIVKDYFMVCESYYSAIKRSSPSQIEAIDMGRRTLHNEGSALLRERLTGKVEMDHDTARRLFTLICVLHVRG